MQRLTGVLFPLSHAETGPARTRGRTPGWFGSTAAVVIVGLVVAACGSASSSVAGDTGTPPTPTPASASQAPSSQGPAASLATAVPTTLDPCQIVTSQEASQMAGATYGAGVESTTEGGGKMCAYGSQTLNVFMVIVGQAPDVATAQAGKAEAEAAIKQQAGNGAQFTELHTFADGAAYYVGTLKLGAESFGAAAFYALKGTVFFGFSDIRANQPPVTLAALEAQAQADLGRLP